MWGNLNVAEEHGNNSQNAARQEQVDRIRPFQWKKGQSGNPGGRPKNESMVSLLRRILEQEHNGKALKELLAERLVKEALAGKFPFAKELLDRVEGLPGKEPRGDHKVVIQVIDVPGKPVEREATLGDRPALTMGETRVREFTKLRDFYEQCPAPIPPGYTPPVEGGTHGT